MKDYYYHINSGDAVFIKEGKFFKDQGGLTSDWGKAWKPIKARSLDHARKIATKIRDEMPKPSWMQ